MNINEKSLDIKSTWYFGNNRSRNLRIARPSWNRPFFLTTSYQYAENYADYGVYKIELTNEKDLNILDFNDNNEVARLNWPKVLVDKIKDGKNDLNSIAYDLHILAFNTGKELMHIDNSPKWQNTANYFKDKSKGIFKRIARSESIWGSEKDHQFLL